MQPIRRFGVGSALVMGLLVALAIAKDDPQATGQQPAAKQNAVPAQQPAIKQNGPVNQQPDVKQNGAPKPAVTVSETPDRSNTDKPARPGDSVEMDAIRQSAHDFVKAFEKADFKTIADQFTPDAEFIDARGNVHRGREGIEQVFKDSFEANSNAKIRLNIDAIRIVSPGVALEDGSSVVFGGEAKEPTHTRYSAVHVKTNGKWLVASVREHAPQDRRQHRKQVEQLSFLEGEWVDEADNSLVSFLCQPVDGGNFLLRRFIVQVGGQVVMSGEQRIGWDPVTNKLKTWVFDSEGGYGEGFWYRDGDRWILKTVGVTADGETASSTSIYTLVNDRTMTWQTVDHEIGGIQFEDSAPITIVRRGPPPETHDEAAPTQSK